MIKTFKNLDLWNLYFLEVSDVMGIRSLIVVVLAVAVVSLNAMPIDDDDFDSTMIGGRWFRVSTQLASFSVERT